MSRSLHVIVRCFSVVVMVAMLAGGAFAAPRERAPKEKVPPIAKLLRTIVRALGDGLTVPLP